MSNHLYVNYLATDMEEASPRGEELVNFYVSIVFADGRYTITASRDDCNSIHERHVDNYSRGAIMRAVCDVLRRCCGYHSRYWLVSVYVDVCRNIKAQLLPYLPDGH